MKNKIIQGDALTILKTMSDESVDCIVTDPPYNTGMTGGEKKARLSHFFNDKFTDEEYLNLVRGGAKLMYKVLKNNAPLYLFMNWKKLGIWIYELKRVGFNIKNTIVWDKVIHGLNYQNYAYTHEFIIFATKGTYKPKNKPGNYWTDMWHIKRNIGNNHAGGTHETVKQNLVVELPILHGSNEGDTILDPFVGSGTTCVAAKKLNRNYLGIELNLEYIKIAEKRISEVPESLGI